MQPNTGNQENNLSEKTKKMTKTDVRQRQQSCMITDIDRDLLPANTKTNVSKVHVVSLSDMLSKDKNDVSLQAYKKNLVGQVHQGQLKEDEAAQVEIIKIQVVSADRPNNNILLNFATQKVGEPFFFQIKQGSTYCLRVHFIVRYDIVNGLKYVNNIYKKQAKVELQQQKMGSFAPQKQPYVFDLPLQEAPSGFMARGEYEGKGLFYDNDGIVHCQFNYVIKIDKNW